MCYKMTEKVQDKYGPGIWFAIHLMAYKTDKDITLKRPFLTYINALAENFPCGECRGHFKNYLSTNPPDKAQELFKWTWEFHNAVNKRLGKKQFTYEESLKPFKTHSPICTDECGSEHITPNPDVKRYYTINSYHKLYDI